MLLSSLTILAIFAIIAIITLSRLNSFNRKVEFAISIKLKLVTLFKSSKYNRFKYLKSEYTINVLSLTNIISTTAITTIVVTAATTTL